MLTVIFDSHLDDGPITFHPPPWVSVVSVAALSITILLATMIYLGVWLAIIATLSGVLAFGLWLRVGYAVPISRRALPGHILLITALLIYGAEQMYGGYANVVIAAFPQFIQPSNIITDESLALSLSLSATVIWLFGGALTFYHVRAGGFVVLLLAVWSVIFPLSNMAIPFLSTSAPGWIPGMASGAIIAVLALLSLRFTLTHPFQRPMP